MLMFSIFVVVSNTPRSEPSAHELAVLSLSGYSSHQNVINYSEVRQNLVANIGGTEDDRRRRVAAPLPGDPPGHPPEKPPAIVTCRRQSE